jgi:hypothetical protein
MPGLDNPDTPLSRMRGIVLTMNRTARLYALVEELRARAPRKRRAAELAARCEVRTRAMSAPDQAPRKGLGPCTSQTHRRWPAIALGRHAT